MSDRFGPAALGLARHAARELGWRPAEFWAATPGELAAALGLSETAPADAMSRIDLQRMMDQDHGRPGGQPAD